MNKEEVIKNQSSHLDKAAFQLNNDYDDQEIVDYLNDFVGVYIGKSSFSKLRHAHKKPEYINQVSRKTCNQILKVLDKKIQEDYNLIWDDGIKEYIKIQENQSITESDIVRLSKLQGVWKGYCYNKRLSRLHKTNWIDIFKITIMPDNKVVGKTHKAEFDNGHITILALSRVIIELHNERRKIVFIGNIGHNYDLQNLLLITLAYVDSADIVVRAGLAVIKRVSESEVIDPTKKAEFTESTEDINLLKFLKGSQVRIKTL